jgi:hypothetical protein
VNDCLHKSYIEDGIKTNHDAHTWGGVPSGQVVCVLLTMMRHMITQLKAMQQRAILPLDSHTPEPNLGGILETELNITNGEL